MNDLIISNRNNTSDKFRITFQYKCEFNPPFTMDGYQLFINNDAKPFISLPVNKKGCWNQ